jgi:hypothetical protein
MEERKRDRNLEKNKDIPVLASTMDAPLLTLGFEPVPRLLFEGRSATVKEFFEKDMLRLKESLKPGRIEPKFAMVNPNLHQQLEGTLDPRTGNADIAVLLPKNVRIPAPSVSGDLLIPSLKINSKKRML